MPGTLGQVRAFCRLFAGLHDAVGGPARLYYSPAAAGEEADLALQLPSAHLVVVCHFDTADIAAARAACGAPLVVFDL